MAGAGVRRETDSTSFVSQEGFLKRWSRRKQEAAVVPAPVPAPKDASQQPVVAAPAGGGEVLAQEPAPLTLADTESLTLASDFKPFLAANVAPAVKNAAFKKLFADPHFNVMDRMDIYIDDYSNLAPLPASALRQMASAKFMNLFEEEEANEAPASASPTDTPASPPAAIQADTPADSAPDFPASPPVVASAQAEAQPASQRPDDPQDTDLRLQPDHAAGAEDARRGAG
ncbi:DUF3306 domain-containing protein [Variovorax rhizosphaerae]|uniref:DUF3306 domain-containing protein n=1 Tax=Variovorax rhizosphaerae TaxID=1836200 RepID=A0ABU8WMH9_9BURK